MTTISIIVPVYNVEQYLPRCIDSILAQTFKDFECILVDDGSPDNCGAICDAYAEKDSRIHVIHKANGGVSSARNAGLDAATGEYVGFADGDDYIKPKHFQNLIEAAQNGLYDAVLGSFCEVDEDGSLIRFGMDKPGIWKLLTKEDHNRFLSGIYLGAHHCWAVWAGIYKRRVVMENQIRFCETCGDYAEDLGFSMAFSLFAKNIRAVDSHEYCYVQRKNSMMDRSKQVLKLNEVNEVSIDFAQYYFRRFSERKSRREYRLLRFLMMRTELGKVWEYGEQHGIYAALYCIEQIQNRKWCWEYRLRYPFDKHVLYELTTNLNPDLFILERYVVHRNRLLYRMDNFLVYRLLRKNRQ